MDRSLLRPHLTRWLSAHRRPLENETSVVYIYCIRFNYLRYPGTRFAVGGTFELEFYFVVDVRRIGGADQRPYLGEDRILSFAIFCRRIGPLTYNRFSTTIRTSSVAIPFEWDIEDAYY